MPNYKVNDKNRHVIITITIKKELYQKIEDQRGRISRSAFCEDLLENGIEEKEKK